jgi:hypothetical protein
MADTPDYELLKDAFAIIAGIPPDAVTLDWTKNKDGASLEKGSVYHPARWLSLHPSFQERGLSASENGKQLRYNGVEGTEGVYSEALAKVFALPIQDVINLFVERGAHMGEEQKLHYTDKDIWLDRVRQYLSTHGAVKPAGVREPAAA